MKLSWMVNLKYRKYEFVSNYRGYNMLWAEFEVLFADIPWQKPNIN